MPRRPVPQEERDQFAARLRLAMEHRRFSTELLASHLRLRRHAEARRKGGGSIDSEGARASRTQLSHWLQAKTLPGPTNIKRLADTLNIPRRWLRHGAERGRPVPPWEVIKIFERLEDIVGELRGESVGQRHSYRVTKDELKVTEDGKKIRVGKSITDSHQKVMSEFASFLDKRRHGKASSLGEGRHETISDKGGSDPAPDEAVALLRTLMNSRNSEVLCRLPAGMLLFFIWLTKSVAERLPSQVSSEFELEGMRKSLMGSFWMSFVMPARVIDEIMISDDEADNDLMEQRVSEYSDTIVEGIALACGLHLGSGGQGSPEEQLERWIFSDPDGKRKP